PRPTGWSRRCEPRCARCESVTPTRATEGSRTTRCGETLPERSASPLAPGPEDGRHGGTGSGSGNLTAVGGTAVAAGERVVRVDHDLAADPVVGTAPVADVDALARHTAQALGTALAREGVRGVLSGIGVVALV